MRKFNIDGHIILSKIDENFVFFNSKFETANLSQVYRVPANEMEEHVEKPATPMSSALKSPMKSPENIESTADLKPKPVVTAEYNLYLSDDTNSDNSLTQWFYFSCFNIKKGNVVRINMLNLMKDDSLYS